jgi:Tol biopolymer transport system component
MRTRWLRLESLEERQMLSVDLLSGVTSGLMLGTAASGISEGTSFAVSTDGRYVAFESSATNLVAGDTNGSRDVFVCDLQTRAMTLVSTTADGTLGNADSTEPAISPDGRYVAFTSEATNLVAGDANACDDIFVKDLASGAVTCVSTATSGGQALGNSSEPSISTGGHYVVFTSSASNLVSSDTNLCDDVFRKDLTTGVTTRVSTDSAGAQGNGESNSAVITSDGRYVAFASLASNFASGDLNAAGDIFVKDLSYGTTARVSTSSSGTASNDASVHPSISDDGQYVAFSSDATNLVTSDTNLVRDIFLKDRLSGATTRLSTSTTGVQATDASGAPAISGDGRYVAFRSDAANLVVDDMNNDADIFLRDLVDGATTRVSTTSAGVEGDDESVHPALSGDGRYVVFSSEAANLAAGDINGFRDLFVKDRAAETVTLVSQRNISLTGPFGASGFSTAPVLSDDGRYVAFTSTATNLVSDDTNNDSDVFVMDTLADDVMRISTDSQGAQANDDSDSPALSGNGRYVAFCSAATDLVSGDTNGCVDVFLKDLETGLLALVSADSAGAAANGDSSQPAVSDDGRYVVFTSAANNLVSGDTNLCADVFRKDLLTGAIARVSTSTASVQGSDISDSPTVSADGRYVAFRSDATNLVTGDTNKDSDVFRKDMSSGAVLRVSTTSVGVQGDDDSSHPTITDDGRYVAFTSDATNLVGSDTNSYQDVFLKDLQTGVTVRISTSSAGAQANGDSAAPMISDDGRYVVFRSEATNLAAGDSNGQEDVFAKDLLTGATTAVSYPSTATVPNNDAFDPALSGDGRYVAFSSDATNLFAGDGNEASDVFHSANWLTNQAPTDLVLSNSYVVENAASGTLVATLTTDDPNPGDTFTYSFAAGTGDIDNDLFTLVDNQLHTAAVFDYETVAAYSVRIRTTDTGGLACEQAFTITVTNVNEAPIEITVTGSLAVAENAAAGTLVCSLATTDPDAGDIHTYTLRDSAEGRFTVQGNQVLVADGAVLDYEASASYSVRVRSTDQGGLWRDEELVITLTNVNEAPTAIPVTQPITVAEYSDAGTLVCSLATTDPDAGDSHTYTLVDTAGGRFALQGDQLVVADGSLLDHNAATSHAIVVRTTDLGGLSYEQRFTVYVTIVNSAPTDITASEPIAVLEDSNAGTVVTTLATTDPNVGDTHTYALVDDANGRFAILGNQVVVADGSLLDYEAATSHAIVVRTTDQGGLTYEEQFTVQVLDAEEPRYLTTIGLFDAATSTFSLRAENTSGPADYTFAYGEPGGGWKVFVGDWDGDGTAGVGLYDPDTSTFYLTNAYQSGYAEYTFGYGVPGQGWIPLVGDWDGNGTAGVGLYDPNASTFYLTNTLEAGYAEYTFGYGAPGDGWKPLVGDWDGNGTAGVGLYDPHASTFYLTNALATGFAEHTFSYGAADAGWTPLVGDWNGDGAAGVGLYDPNASTFYLTNAFVNGYAQYMFGYGAPSAGWTPLVGDWDGDGATGVGLYDPDTSTFYLTNQLSAGVAEYTVQFGTPSADLVPLAGCWETTSPATTLSAAAVDQLDLAELAATELRGLP